jgi:hypothetical protein
MFSPAHSPKRFLSITNVYCAVLDEDMQTERFYEPKITRKDLKW